MSKKLIQSFKTAIPAVKVNVYEEVEKGKRSFSVVVSRSLRIDSEVEDLDRRTALNIARKTAEWFGTVPKKLLKGEHSLKIRINPNGFLYTRVNEAIDYLEARGEYQLARKVDDAYRRHMYLKLASLGVISEVEAKALGRQRAYSLRGVISR